MGIVGDEVLQSLTTEGRIMREYARKPRRQWPQLFPQNSASRATLLAAGAATVAVEMPKTQPRKRTEHR